MQVNGEDSTAASCLGTVFGREEFRQHLESIGVSCINLRDEQPTPRLADVFAQENVVSGFHGPIWVY
ncbi:MAG: hypothetical protein OEN02_01190 [Gammaproteobacteria bacterium]|nr:hypothetical protein [Gammaproteobacteria bacterium]MDH3536606.1 hypothetical protein [Gammaproteobacteria bacterium]